MEVVGGSKAEVSPKKKARPYLKNNLKKKRAGSMAHVAECLISSRY
jgi:hypothetical protein